MARVPIKIYPKSLLATLASLLGSVFFMMAIVLALKMEWIGAIVCVLGLIGMNLWAEKINERKIEKKTFKLWVKELEKQGYDQMIAQSVEYAVSAYNAYPCKRTLKYIAQRNPYAARYIAEQTQRKN